MDRFALSNMLSEFSAQVVGQTLAAAPSRRRLAFAIKESALDLFGRDFQVLELSDHAINLAVSPEDDPLSLNSVAANVLELPNATLQLALVLAGENSAFPSYEQATRVLSRIEYDLGSKKHIYGSVKHLFSREDGPVLKFRGKGGFMVTLQVLPLSYLPDLLFQFEIVAEQLQKYPDKLQPLILFVKQVLFNNGIHVKGSSIVKLCSDFLRLSSTTAPCVLGSVVDKFLEIHSNSSAICACDFKRSKSSQMIEAFSHAFEIVNRNNVDDVAGLLRDSVTSKCRRQKKVPFPPSDHLYLGNLDASASEKDITGLVEGILKEPPNRVIMHHNVPGNVQHCFVWCNSQSQAAQCIEALNNMSYLGRALIANYAFHRKESAKAMPTRTDLSSPKKKHTKRTSLKNNQQQRPLSPSQKENINVSPRKSPPLTDTLELKKSGTCSRQSALPNLTPKDTTLPVLPPPLPQSLNMLKEEPENSFLRGPLEPSPTTTTPQIPAPTGIRGLSNVLRQKFTNSQHVPHPITFMPFVFPPENKVFIPPGNIW